VDHGSIVWDEIIAVGWALWLVVAVGVSLDAWRVLLIFVLFRVFDIVKPWPIYFVDAWHTSWGVMWDDLLAAAYTVIGFFILMPLWI
jgi:phosphatidylglycerophosphatase A